MIFLPLCFVALGKIPCAYFSLCIFANMQAIVKCVIVNETKVALSNHMEKSEYFEACGRFGTNGTVTIDQYTDQFLILNASTGDRYRSLKHMRLEPFLEVFKALNYFGCCDELIISVKRSLTILFNTYTTAQLLSMTTIDDFLYYPVEHPEYIHISHVHCNVMRLRISNMTTVAELNEVADYVLAIADEELRNDYAAAAIRLATSIAIVEIERQIHLYMRQYPGYQALSVDWSNLPTCGLSQQFIDMHAYHMGERAALLRNDDIRMRATLSRPLHLYGLPIKQRANMYARARIGSPEFWEGRPYIDDRISINEQWNRDHRLEHYFA